MIEITVPIPCGHPETFPGCHFCNLAETDIRYAKLFARAWGPRNPEEQKQLAKWTRIRTPCKHLGAVLKESKNCGCPKVFDCAIKGRVTKIGIHPEEPGLPQCFECEIFQP